MYEKCSLNTQCENNIYFEVLMRAVLVYGFCQKAIGQYYAVFKAKNFFELRVEISLFQRCISSCTLFNTKG